MPQRREDYDERFTAAFGKIIASLRVDREWTQAELAVRAGIGRQYVSEIENGHKNPSVDVARALARELGVELAVLIRRAERHR